MFNTYSTTYSNYAERASAAAATFTLQSLGFDGLGIKNDLNEVAWLSY
jgi:hypothetical protein